MHILGLTNGTPGGNSEILLKAALKAAVDEINSSCFSSSITTTTTTSWIHVPSVSIPINPAPLRGSSDVSNGHVKAMQSIPSPPPSPSHTTRTNREATINGSDNNRHADRHLSPKQQRDDRQIVLDEILKADAIMISTPIYSHQPAGPLKNLIDRILGPFTDASFATAALERLKLVPEHQRTPAQRLEEERVRLVLKPRVVGLMAVGGSKLADQVTMALPTLQSLVYSLHAKVVDQFVAGGCAAPGSVLLGVEGGTSKEMGLDDDDDDRKTKPTNMVGRAELLGRNIASQMGKKSFDDAEYLGPRKRGACPNCHLLKFEILGRDDEGDFPIDEDEKEEEEEEEGGGRRIGCLACGTHGGLKIEDGKIVVVWDRRSGQIKTGQGEEKSQEEEEEEESEWSCITMKGKLKHVLDIQRAGKREAELIKEAGVGFEQKLRKWRTTDLGEIKFN